MFIQYRVRLVLIYVRVALFKIRLLRKSVSNIPLPLLARIFGPWPLRPQLLCTCIITKQLLYTILKSVIYCNSFPQLQWQNQAQMVTVMWTQNNWREMGQCLHRKLQPLIRVHNIKWLSSSTLYDISAFLASNCFKLTVTVKHFLRCISKKSVI